ncbi:hypothetical protein ACO0LC_18885 [Undibacterium sp. JH2W]
MKFGSLCLIDSDQRLANYPIYLDKSGAGVISVPYLVLLTLAHS